MSGLQLPFSFVPRDMSEQHANFLLSADYKGKTLTWTFPVRAGERTGWV